MNWVSETQKALSKALARVILPEILLPALLVDGGFGALALLLAIRVVGRLPLRLPKQEISRGGFYSPHRDYRGARDRKWVVFR